MTETVCVCVVCVFGPKWPIDKIRLKPICIKTNETKWFIVSTGTGLARRSKIWIRVMNAKENKFMKFNAMQCKVKHKESKRNLWYSKLCYLRSQIRRISQNVRIF